MTKTFCDYCKKEITKDYNYGRLHIARYGSCRIDQNTEVCQNCLKKLDKTLQEMKKDQK